MHGKGGMRGKGGHTWQRRDLPGGGGICGKRGSCAVKGGRCAWQWAYMAREHAWQRGRAFLLNLILKRLCFSSQLL